MPLTITVAPTSGVPASDLTCPLNERQASCTGTGLVGVWPAAIGVVWAEAGITCSSREQASGKRKEYFIDRIVIS